MRILVLGCNGMAGHLISLYFKERGYLVDGFARSNSEYLQKTHIGDATNLAHLGEIVLNNNYDAVINCIGLLNQFAESDKPNAVLINSYLPHYLANITKDSKTKIIHMSTDCVFAGNDGPYFEDSIPNGVTFYDRTKAIGEINNNKDLTFRNSIVGPDIKESGIGLFNWFMRQEGQIKGFTGAIWTGVTTLTLAKAMECALREKLTGLYNLVNNKSINKFELCSLFNHHFRKDELSIIPDDVLQLDKSLRSNRNDFNFKVPTYEEQIKEMREWVENHSDIYSHYTLR